MMALVRALAPVLFRQFDAAGFELIDRTDVHAVGADDFHMLFDIHLPVLS
jgi:hypothetical protein